MEKFEIENNFGETEVCTLSVNKYSDNGHVAVQIWCEDGPYAKLTVNLSGIKKFDKNFSAIDTNNFPDGTSLAKELGVAKPIYEFDMQKLQEYTEGGE